MLVTTEFIYCLRSATRYALVMRCVDCGPVGVYKPLNKLKLMPYHHESGVLICTLTDLDSICITHSASLAS